MEDKVSELQVGLTQQGYFLIHLQMLSLKNNFPMTRTFPENMRELKAMNKVCDIMLCQAKLP